MALLAAHCPNCGTAFRVVSDQLKLKGGLVRCGECQRVFDALIHLNTVEEAAPPPAPSKSKETKPREEEQRDPQQGAPITPNDTPSATARPAQDARLAGAPSDTVATPEMAGTEFVPPFLRVRKARPLTVAAWSAVLLLLTFVLVVQISLLLRGELVGRWPALRPALEELCRYAQCTVQWPRRPELLALIGTDLEALPGTDAFEFSGTLRSRAEFTVAAPAIELTLAAADGRVVARKVWLPQQLYGDAGRGIEAGGELEFRIGFAAPGIKPESFVAYPLYAD